MRACGRTELVPFERNQDRDFDDAKLAILDVLAQDAEDRRYNIEMQTTLPVELPSRLTFYN